MKDIPEGTILTVSYGFIVNELPVMQRKEKCRCKETNCSKIAGVHPDDIKGERTERFIRVSDKDPAENQENLLRRSDTLPLFFASRNLKLG